MNTVATKTTTTTTTTKTATVTVYKTTTKVTASKVPIKHLLTITKPNLNNYNNDNNMNDLPHLQAIIKRENRFKH